MKILFLGDINAGKMLNSTEIFNPDFDDLETENMVKSHRTPVNQELKCLLCDKTFSNSYNRKLHQISVHHYFPKGMQIYSCTHSKCKFVCGSKRIYSKIDGT